MKLQKLKKIILYSVLSVCVTCCSYGFRNEVLAGEITCGMNDVESASQYMANQMANGDCNGVKESINKFLIVIEQFKNVKKGLYTESTYYADKMLGHLRLVRIEEKQGNLEERSNHLEIAKEACIHRHVDYCTEEKLIWYGKRFEEKHPIACLSK